MKTFFVILSVLFLATLFNGCLKDVQLNKYTYYVPEYAPKAEVQAAIKSSAPQPIEKPGRIYVKGNYIYINEAGKGIHIIDYSQLANPQNIAYIPIPGNGNLSIQGNYLYADEYTDLMTIDISDPHNAKLVDTTNNVFTENPFGNVISDQVIKSWRRVDTMIRSNDPILSSGYYNTYPGGIYFDDVETFSSGKSNSGGMAGSMAQFTVLNDRLYSVSSHYLNIINIESPVKPAFVKSIFSNAGGFETIYPFENNLFIGSTNAMYIYDVTDKDNPTETGNFGHVHVCDPVIAEPGLAYVTLRSGTMCNGQENELDVLNTNDLANPVLIKAYPFTNPRGLAKDGNLLFICDGPDGLKILDAADVNDITQTSVVTGFEPNDVIAADGIAIVTATDGLYLVDYSKPGAASAVGKINITQ